jgi:hypothetical protein
LSKQGGRGVQMMGFTGMKPGVGVGVGVGMVGSGMGVATGGLGS